MAAPITFRPDEETRRALEELTPDGTTVSAARRDALVEATGRHAEARLRAEAEAAAADADDRAEAARVLRDMEQLWVRGDVYRLSPVAGRSSPA